MPPSPAAQAAPVKSLHFPSTVKLRKYTLDELRAAISGSVSIRQALQKLNVKAEGGNYQSFHRAVRHFALDTSHFTGMNLSGRYPSDEGNWPNTSSKVPTFSPFDSSVTCLSGKSWNPRAQTAVGPLGAVNLFPWSSIIETVTVATTSSRTCGCSAQTAML